MNAFVSSVLLPPALPMILSLLGLVLLWTWRRTALALLTIGVLSSYALSIPVVSATLVRGLQTQPPVTPEQIAEREPQWIVVLAGGKDVQRPDWGGETVSRYSLGRLRYGARLARETGLPVLLSGGVLDDEGEPEAALMRRAMREEFGIQRVVAETDSRNTHENATRSAAALRANNATRILLVTHALHMRRAGAAFARQGVEVVPAPTEYFNSEIEWSDPRIWLPSGRSIEIIHYALHERLGWLWYDWQGWVVADDF